MVNVTLCEHLSRLLSLLHELVYSISHCLSSHPRRSLYIVQRNREKLDFKQVDSVHSSASSGSCSYSPSLPGAYWPRICSMPYPVSSVYVSPIHVLPRAVIRILGCILCNSCLSQPCQTQARDQMISPDHPSFPFHPSSLHVRLTSVHASKTPR